MYLRCIYTSAADSRTLRRLAASALVCLLGAAGVAGEVHEVESRHVRCEVHGGFRHDESPTDSQDLHTDDHGDLKFLQHAVTPSLLVVPVVQFTVFSELPSLSARVTVQKKVWAFAPKGSPPRA